MNDKVRILVVDDEPVVRHAYQRTLASEHCELDMACDGNEALAKMRRKPSDIVLLDLRMPGPDGLTVLKTIKDRWPESEVVVITGYAALDTAKASVALGAFDYLAKPVGPDEVIEVTRGALLRKGWALHRDAPAPFAPGACAKQAPLSAPLFADPPREESPGRCEGACAPCTSGRRDDRARGLDAAPTSAGR